MSVHTEIGLVVLEFVVHIHLHCFVHKMQGPKWVTAPCFVGAVHFFCCCNAFQEVGVVGLQCEAVFPLDHYVVGLLLRFFAGFKGLATPCESPLPNGL